MSTMRYVVNAPWPADEVEKLKAWRSANIGNAEIAKRLGRTKVAVTAKVRALKLPPLAERSKPPPHGQPRTPEVKRAPATTLPPLASLQKQA